MPGFVSTSETIVASPSGAASRSTAFCFSSRDGLLGELGRPNISITLDRYGHLMPGNEAEAAGLLDAYPERADTAAKLTHVAGEGLGYDRTFVNKWT